MKHVLVIAKALSEASRVRVLMCLEQGALCAGQIAEVLGLAPSTVSKHMGILVQADLVDTWSEGRWRYYRLARPQMNPLARNVLAEVCEGLSSCPTCQADLAKARELRNRSDAPVPGRNDNVLRPHASAEDLERRAAHLRRPADVAPTACRMGYDSNEVRQG